MGSRIQVFLLVISVQILLVAAFTNPQDVAAISALKDAWQNTPPSWVGQDPCDNNWEGIQCTNSRVTAITLASMNLTGQLPGDIGSLSELLTLDLSYNLGLTGSLPVLIGKLTKLSNLLLVGCNFFGPIPNEIGSLQRLVMLALNSNHFTGNIPPTIGNLTNLYWLDLADNKLKGTIPVSSGTTPGLDMLVNTKHFHFGKNNLSGEIPSKLFSSNMSLIHLLLDSNQLSGNIPSTLGSMQNLEALRLDRNLLNGSVPPNLNNLVNVRELFLSNNQLSGSLPNLTGMATLNYMSISNNSFNGSDVTAWFSTLQSLTTLTTLMMENVGLQGEIPTTLFGLPQLQTLVLRNNKLSGTLDVGSSFSSQLQLIDLWNNSIDSFTYREDLKFELILGQNPFCTGASQNKYCIVEQYSPIYPTQTNNCMSTTCSSDKIASPNCVCEYPYTGTIVFRALSFSYLGNPSIYTSLTNSLMDSFQSLKLPVDSVSLGNLTTDSDNYFVLSVTIFPSGQDYFNRTGIYEIAFMFTNQTFKPDDKFGFGPYVFHAAAYGNLEGSAGTNNKSSSTGIIIGAAVGGSVLLLLSLLAGIYAFRQKRRAEIADKQNNPFASWDPSKSDGDVPQLKGARNFTFEELRKYTNNFSEANSIGSGGYGKVYRGTLPAGQLVAVKRAQHGSMQGGIEFKSEIELLSRVHHKNIVSLVGFCFEQDEQMLVYEYIPNGTLRESLLGKSGIRLDWMRRLRIALGSARGLQYLHELANPTIIHRDVKTNNILLDERLNAKVADFGLSKSKAIGDSEKDHITTQVKGTMGYMDPEYYMTNQLTEKSDVYSFGVVMLELITARQPIEKGKYIVREVKQKMDKTKVGYNLHDVLDTAILGTTLGGLEKFVDLAMRCVEESNSSSSSPPPLPHHQLLSTLLITAVPLLLFIIFITQSRRKLPYPPGPKGFPVIGNMLMMDQLTHRGLARLAEQYGGLFHLKMGGLHMVAISSPEIARDVLQAQDSVFSNRPATMAIAYLTYDRADMAFAQYGPFWRQMRKICVMKVFSRKRAESWASVREEVDLLIGNIATKVGSPINVGEAVFCLTKNIIYRAAFGTITDEGQEEFVKILQEFSKLFAAFNIADFFPSMGWIHGKELNNRLEKARRSLDGFIDKIIDEHVEKKKKKGDCENDDDGEVETDMVDELMAFYSEDGRKGDGDELKITKDNIKALIMDVMFGGTETVASAIEWSMAELMKNREDLKKVQQELADVVGLHRKVNESDLENLPYFKCVIKETLRLHPPIPLLLHETAVDAAVAGFRIPAKSRVMINAWAINRDKNSWVDPDSFKPSRFLNGGAPDFKGSNFEFLPFGSGRRSCPGMQLGLYAMELAVAHLCHCYSWELPDGMKPSELDMNDVFGLTAPRAIQLVAVPSHRLLGSHA